MVIFNLSTKKVKGLDGDVEITHSIERQTDKAVLFAIIHDNKKGSYRKVPYWFAKKIIKIDGEPCIGEVKPTARTIEIPNWAWDDRKIAE